MSPKKIFKWSSHNPVIFTALDILDPEFILELGMGNFSSPLFLKSNAKTMIHIENNENWINIVKSNHMFDGRSEIIFHNLNAEISNSTKISKVPLHVIEEAKQFYHILKNKIQNNFKTKLLFVDQFACLRTLSINTLADDFDWIIYHDAEAPEEYNYGEIKKELNDTHYHFILETYTSWTGFFIKKTKCDEKVMRNTLLKNVETFAKPFNVDLSTFKIKSV